jgi:hypothetical protein
MVTLRTRVFGTLLLFAVGCQRDQFLGDLATAGEGGESSGGSSTGGSSSGGTVSAGMSSGGTVSAGTSNGGSFTAGTSNGTAGSGGGVGCFSPDVNPELGLDGGVVGCPCESEEEVCVAVTEGQRLHLIALVCSEGSWHSVLDGPCEPTPGNACMIGNRIYRQGEFIGPPFDCNASVCGPTGPEGTVDIACPPRTCPEGTISGSRCRACGVEDSCDIVETGCFPTCVAGDTCDIGRCAQGFCFASCPI